MRFLDNLRRIRALLARGGEVPIGDLAVLKTDMTGVDVRPALRPLLEPVRGWLPAIDLDALAALPPNTFGHAYARFMRENGLDPFVVTDAIDAEMRRRNAFGIRYATTHDMFHVLLDYGASWPGEMGVLAFAIGQSYTRAQVLGGVLAWLVYPWRCGFAFGALWRAWRRGLDLGRRAPFLLGVRLEDRFGDDLAAVRRDLSLDAPPAAGSTLA